MVKKNPKADLRSLHTIFTQLGIILVLVFLIAAAKTEIHSTPTETIQTLPVLDGPLIELPPQIKPQPPAPHKPAAMIEVPNHKNLAVDIIEFGVLGLDDPIPLPDEPEKEPEPDVYDSIMIEVLPVMKGGLKKLYSHIEYPEKARRAGIEGRVQVEFIVGKNGEIENPRITRAIGGGCDEEVLKAIKLMEFTPGVQNGNLVKVRMSQVVVFKLNN